MKAVYCLSLSTVSSVEESFVFLQSHIHAVYTNVFINKFLCSINRIRMYIVLLRPDSVEVTNVDTET